LIQLLGIVGLSLIEHSTSFSKKAKPFQFLVFIICIFILICIFWIFLSSFITSKLELCLMPLLFLPQHIYLSKVLSYYTCSTSPPSSYCLYFHQKHSKTATIISIRKPMVRDSYRLGESFHSSFLQ